MQVTRQNGREFEEHGGNTSGRRRKLIAGGFVLLTVAALGWYTQTAATPVSDAPPPPVTAVSAVVEPPQTAPITLDPYAALEQELWEEQRLSELVAEERARVEHDFEAALAAARTVDPYEEAFIGQLKDESPGIDRAKLRTRIAPYHLDPWQAYEDELWRDEVARDARLQARQRIVDESEAALAVARTVDPWEAAYIEQLMSDALSAFGS